MPAFVASPDAQTWVEGAQDSPFPIQNIPFGTAVVPDRGETLVAAVGDQVIDCQALLEGGLLDPEQYPSLFGFFELAEGALPRLRKDLFDLLLKENPDFRDSKKLRKTALIPASKVELQVPIPPNDYVDFYAGIHHASNVGRMFRPDQEPLLPNYRHVPIGYHGKSGSIIASGVPVVRPKGQIKAGDQVEFAPTRELDFELEMGFYVGEGQEPSRRITCTQADEHILGLVIVNDWSSRDVQRWEYQPLGPFLAKSFATTVSPWVVTLDALEPFRVEGMEQTPPVLPYLRRHGRQHFDIELQVSLKTAKMKTPQVICRSNTQHLYWSMAQQLAHLTSNGSPVSFGDLCATGTISAPEESGFGSLLELTWRGSKPLTLESGEQRTFLEDGDEVIMTAWAQGEGFRVGFGEARAKILKAN
jgi:fumarylacetoacetase